MSNKVEGSIGKIRGKRCQLASFLGVLHDNNLIGELKQGPCKIVCNLDQNLAFGLKIPCMIKEGKGEARCQYALYSRALSAEAIALEQYRKYAECLLPNKEHKVEKEAVPLSTKARMDKIKQ